MKAKKARPPQSEACANIADNGHCEKVPTKLVATLMLPGWLQTACD
jgi:hypothetical protein